MSTFSLRGVRGAIPLEVPLLLALCAACGGSSQSRSTDHADHTAERSTITPAECEARGGQVIGDIGDGAVHRPDYRCASGEPPVATVSSGIEGSVCCMP